MKNKIKLSIALILVSILTFAQPNPDTLPGEQDQLDAPINQNILVLILAVIIFGFMYFRKHTELQKN